MIQKESPSIAQVLLATLLVIVFGSCSSYKRFIRVDPHMAACKSDIDTIAVFSDALVAIDARNDYYSENGSYMLDSLILSGIQKSLKGKGYATKRINPLFLGSFMDSFQYVPVKRINTKEINSTRLPVIFQNELSKCQLEAFGRTCRRLYLQTIHGKSDQLSLQTSNPIVKSDLDTLQHFIKCDNALFIFHQAVLVDPAITIGMMVGTIALTGILSGGTVFGYVTKVNFYHTYMILVQLSTGNIIWSNYSSFDAAPADPIFRISKGNRRSLSEPKMVKSYVLWRWHDFNLEEFPKKDDPKMFMGYRKKKKYPSQNLFQKTSLAFFNDLRNSKLKRRIDSTITALSISEGAIPEIPHDSIGYDFGKGRSVDSLQPTIDAVMRYLHYAYYCRLRFKPTLKGEMKIQFVITADGDAKKITFKESTLSDRILEYEFEKIIRGVGFGKTNDNDGAVLITKKMVFNYLKE